MRRPAASLFAVLLAALAAACATATRRAELRRALDEARISRPPAEIWPEVQRFLDGRGYPLVGEDRLAVGKLAQRSISRVFSLGFETRVLADGSRVLETDTLGQTRTRVRVEAAPAEGGGSRLRVRLIRHAEMSKVETTESRDEDLEVALLESLDPAAAARVTGRPPAPPKAKAASTVPATSPVPATPPEPAAPTAPAASADGWARVRPVLGSWTGKLADGTPARWRFEFAGDGQFLEIRGTPLRFASTAARGGGDEMGRISRSADGDRLVWNHFTNAGRVDRYEATATAADAEGLVFVAQSPESFPAGTRVRLVLRRSGDQLQATLDIAEPGKDFAPAGEIRFTRVP